MILRVPDHPGVGAPPEQEEAESISEMEIIQDGCYRDLIFLDKKDGENKEARKARTLIRRVSITKMDELAKAWGKIAHEACVYIDLPMNEVEKLTHESFAIVIREGRRLNFTLLSKWLEWNGQTLKALGGSVQIDEIIAKVTRQMQEAKERG